jgi:hypothetical protein
VYRLDERSSAALDAPDRDRTVILLTASPRTRAPFLERPFLCTDFWPVVAAAAGTPAGAARWRRR